LSVKNQEIDLQWQANEIARVCGMQVVEEAAVEVVVV
jgi:hypothetical protein